MKRVQRHIIGEWNEQGHTKPQDKHTFLPREICPSAFALVPRVQYYEQVVSSECADADMITEVNG